MSDFYKYYWADLQMARVITEDRVGLNEVILNLPPHTDVEQEIYEALMREWVENYRPETILLGGEYYFSLRRYCSRVFDLPFILDRRLMEHEVWILCEREHEQLKYLKVRS